MEAPPSEPETPQPAAPPRGRIQVNVIRAAAAAALLGGLFALLFFVFLPGGGAGSVEPAELVDTPTDDPTVSVGVRPGEFARDFEASNLDGERFRLSDLRGRPLVINFWATWCTSCLAEMPDLEAQRKLHEDDGLAIVAVNVGEGEGNARNFIEALELFDFAVAMDPDLSVADAYRVRGLPQSVFVDRDGVIQAGFRGELNVELMEQYVTAAIDAVPGAEPPTDIRLITTIPRDHVLDVVPDQDDSTRLTFVSRRFRCDDSYCAETELGDQLAGVVGVIELDLRSAEALPEVVVSFDASVTTAEQVISAVADVLRSNEDPVYSRELEVRFPEGGV